jgi:hypothetical protein
MILRIHSFLHRDVDLKMFHLQRMDHDFYMTRAEWKSKQNFNMNDVKAGRGYQHIYSGEKAEQFFATIVGDISEIPEQYRLKALF